MNAKAALCVALLNGEVVSIKTGFKKFGITNIPREISRLIEDEKRWGFGVMVSRTHRVGKSKYGVVCTWIDYRLNKTDYNANGIKKMQEYIKKHSSKNDDSALVNKILYKQTQLELQ